MTRFSAGQRGLRLKNRLAFCVWDSSVGERRRQSDRVSVTEVAPGPIYCPTRPHSSTPSRIRCACCVRGVLRAEIKKPHGWCLVATLSASFTTTRPPRARHCSSPFSCGQGAFAPLRPHHQHNYYRQSHNHHRQGRQRHHRHHHDHRTQRCQHR